MAAYSKRDYAARRNSMSLPIPKGEIIKSNMTFTRVFLSSVHVARQSYFHKREECGGRDNYGSEKLGPRIRHVQKNFSASEKQCADITVADL